MKRPTLPWTVWLGLVISLLALIASFYGIQFDELFERLRRVSWPQLAAGLGLFCLYLIVISQRWRLILAPICRPKLVDALSSLIIGRLANNLLPFRMGDIVRAAVLGQRMQVSKASVLGTVVLDRLLDTLALVTMVIFLIFTADIPTVVKKSAFVFSVVGFLALLVLWLIARNRPEFKQLIDRLLHFAPEQIKNTIVNFVDSFSSGLQTLLQMKSLFPIILYSILAWLIVIAIAQFFLKAVGLNFSWQVPLFLVIITNLGAAIPASPGSLGVFHALVIYALALWSVEKEAALSMGIVYHETLYLFVLILGIGALWYQGYSLAGFRNLIERQSTVEVKST